MKYSIIVSLAAFLVALSFNQTASAEEEPFLPFLQPSSHKPDSDYRPFKTPSDSQCTDHTWIEPSDPNEEGFCLVCTYYPCTYTVSDDEAPWPIYAPSEDPNLLERCHISDDSALSCFGDIIGINQMNPIPEDLPVIEFDANSH